MDDSIRAQLRPYYDEDTFNIGYPAVFKPDEGVVDPNGFTIASKLKIVKNASSGGKRLLRGSTGTGAGSSILSTLFPWISKGDAAKTHSNEWIDIVNLKIWRRIMEKLVDQFVRSYIHHLIQQPFEVTRYVLQVGDFGKSNEVVNKPIELADRDIVVDYFPMQKDVNGETLPAAVGKEPQDTKEYIKPASLHTLDVMNSIMEEEGIRGLWRANNTTFIYNFVNLSLNAWLRGFFSPLLGLSDQIFLDVNLNADDIKKIVILYGLCNVMAGLLLIPIDLVKTKLMVTSMISPDTQKRSLRKNLKKWSWKNDYSKMPLEIWALTALNSLLGSSKGGTVSYYGGGSSLQAKLIESVVSQEGRMAKWYNVALQCGYECVKLFIRLPIETLLHRCQVKYLLNTVHNIAIQERDLILKPVITTATTGKTDMWRGWRVSCLGILCGHGLRLLDPDMKNAKGTDVELEF